MLQQTSTYINAWEHVGTIMALLTKLFLQGWFEVRPLIVHGIGVTLGFGYMHSSVHKGIGIVTLPASDFQEVR